MAKRCAKKLPPSTTVVAVDNGKVIFQRSAAKKLAGSNVNMNFKYLLLMCYNSNDMISILQITLPFQGRVCSITCVQALLLVARKQTMV